MCTTMDWVAVELSNANWDFNLDSFVFSVQLKVSNHQNVQAGSEPTLNFSCCSSARLASASHCSSAEDNSWEYCWVSFCLQTTQYHNCKYP